MDRRFLMRWENTLGLTQHRKVCVSAAELADELEALVGQLRELGIMGRSTLQYCDVHITEIPSSLEVD